MIRRAQGGRGTAGRAGKQREQKKKTQGGEAATKGKGPGAAIDRQRVVSPAARRRGATDR
jgi:hypothetical protein